MEIKISIVKHMDEHELKEQIEIILIDEQSKIKRKNVRKNYSHKIEYIYSPISGRHLHKIDVQYNYINFPEKLPDPTKIELNYENLELLMKLFDSIRYSNNLSKYFISYLYNIMETRGIGSLASEALIKLGHFDIVIDYIYPSNCSKLYPLFSTLEELLFYEYSLFSKAELTKIKQNVGYIINYKDNLKKEMALDQDMIGKGYKILERINIIFHKALAQSLQEGINFQINIDRTKLKEKIRSFGFDNVLADALDKIEEMYWTTSSDVFDYSMAIDKLRSFWEITVESICKKIKDKTGHSYPTTEKTQIANLRLYIKEQLQLDKEHQLMNKLVDILNDKGSHNLISEREYFRLTKNITIEVAMLLFIKLEQFLK